MSTTLLPPRHETVIRDALLARLCRSAIAAIAMRSLAFVTLRGRPPWLQVSRFTAGQASHDRSRHVLLG
jgi:hypothetical protein